MRSLLKLPTIFLLLLLPLLLPAQNLVPNPGFEEYTECPTGTSQIEKATGWEAYGVKRGTPDYFHECSFDSVPSSSGWYIMAGVPNNTMGHQYAKEGMAYAGFFTYLTDTAFGNIFREIIGIKLTQPLQTGVTYHISFWLSPGYGRYYDAKWFSNKTGARFSMQPYSWDSQSPIPAAPIDNLAHVYTDSIFTDTNRWHLVSGSFIADKPYPYLMLGNFFDNDHTDIITHGIQNYAAYYYIDNVCVSEVPNYCYTSEVDSSASDTSCERSVLVFPNPASSQVYVQLPCEESHSIQVIDALGRMVVRQDDFDRHTEVMELEVHGLAAGSYFIRIESSLRRYTLKLIIVH